MKDFSKTNPTNLSEAVDILIASMEKEDKEYILKTDLDQLTCEAHFGLGLAIRNTWIYRDDSSLGKYLFENCGLLDPDDMSSGVLDAFFRKVKGLPEKQREHIGLPFSEEPQD